MQLLSIEEIEQHIPRLMLGDYPTPLHKSRGLQQHLGVSGLWFKRDDLISFGFGGNKIRALEVIANNIIKQNCDVIITGAGVQSNHVRASAALASYLGISMAAVFWGQNTKNFDGNYRITKMLGAHTFFTGDPERASVDQGIEKVAKDLLAQGRRPYKIPRGGACPEGVLGHVLAVCETLKQCGSMNIKPDRIILAVGSGGTHAGWLLGTRLLGLNWQINGISVSRAANEAKHQVARLANEAAELIQMTTEFAPSDVNIDDNFIGDGYGIPTPEGADAIKQTALHEGILLDPTYTGKAMSAYLTKIKNNRLSKHETVLYIHTGGEPTFFAGDGDWLNC